jgi:hypothetical protein
VSIQTGLDQGGSLFLLIEAGQNQMAIPSDLIGSVSDWVNPYPLPRGATGVLGWLPREGQALPVLDPATLGIAENSFSVLVLVDTGRVAFFLPSGSARFVRGTAGLPPEGAPDFARGSLGTDDGRRSLVVDADRLYRAFHLGYNQLLDG